MNKKKWPKMALALSACLFVIWWALGTGATLAWFSDRDEVRNEFQIGLLNLDVNFKNDIVTVYTPLQGSSEVFNDQALYEPGYTQVVFLEIENLGNIDFNYKLAVTVEDYDPGYNQWDKEIYLPNYLRFGVVFGESEAEVKELVKARLEARTHAPNVLDTWSDLSPYTFEAGEEPHYAALVIYMPEEVGNVANYRGVSVPRVKLGIKVFAQQANAPMD